MVTTMILFREEDIFTALEPDDKGIKVGRIRTGFGADFVFFRRLFAVL